MNVFERMDRELFPTVSSYSRTRGHQKKLSGRTRKEKMFFHIFWNSSVHLLAAGVCGCGKFIWVQKISRQIHRSKIHQGALSKKDISAQEVGEPQIIWSRST